MALVDGTNCGFVSATPSGDPAGGGGTVSLAFNTFSHPAAGRFTSPAGATKITELGVWINYQVQNPNFKVGLYSHDSGNNEPDALLYSSDAEALTASNSWQGITVDWSISGSTTYWLAVWVAKPAAAASITTDQESNASYRRSLYTSDVADFENPWADAAPEIAYEIAIYAVYASGTPVNASMTLSWTAALSAAATVTTNIEAACTLSWTVALSADGNIQANWQTTAIATIKRVVVAGNNEIWYEDI